MMTRFIRISGSTAYEYGISRVSRKDYSEWSMTTVSNVSQKAPLLVCAKVSEAKEYSNLPRTIQFWTLQFITTRRYIKTLNLLNKEQRGLSAWKWIGLTIKWKNQAQVINECISALQSGALTPEKFWFLSGSDTKKLKWKIPGVSIAMVLEIRAVTDDDFQKTGSKV